ncbi:hypothetical protein QOZ80_2BG0196830 [Eleusine coracana subsp. coracana]|nr:hypothetical protein QOZ80_2BG0196830 [Eleusine coracana subsp. coracana]
MTTAAFPSWIMLERFVFRRDDEESFPNAPISARGIHLLGCSLLRGFLSRRAPARLPNLHAVTGLSRSQETGNSCFSLKALPACMEPDLDFHTCRDGRRSRRHHAPPQPEKEARAMRRVMTIGSMGILCRGEQEFAVAELILFKPSRTQIFADICMLRSGTSSGCNCNPGGEWNSMRVPIHLNGDNPAHDDMWLLCCWQTDTVVPFNRYLCWIDYYRGILFCDVFAEPSPTVYFHRFPLKEFPSTPNRSKTSSWLYRGATAINDTMLMFVDVERNDGIGYGELKPSAGFTITCYTFSLNRKDWTEEYKVTSEQLWLTNTKLPREILMFPQVNIDRPHVVNFLISEFKYVMKKMWVVAIDMKTKTVESFYQYINGFEDRQTEDADLTIEKSDFPKPFLPCEFSKFLRYSRKRKNTV